jgi:hypothetical protein
MLGIMTLTEQVRNNFAIESVNWGRKQPMQFEFFKQAIVETFNKINKEQKYQPEVQSLLTLKLFN